MSKVFPFSFKTSSWESCHTTGTHADIVHLPAQHSKQRWKYNPHVQSGPWCHYFPRPQSEGGSFINRSFTHLAIQSCHHVEKNKTKNPTLDQMQKLAHTHESSSTQTLLSVVPSAYLLPVTALDSCLIWASGSKFWIMHVLFLLGRGFIWLRLSKKKKKGVELFWWNTSLPVSPSHTSSDRKWIFFAVAINSNCNVFLYTREY